MSRIATIEEQHVSHYESMMDAGATWAQMLVLHEYNECYLYHSFMQTKVDPRIKQLWELHLAMEIEHLRLACELMRKLDRTDPEAILPKELPDPITFRSNRKYLRKVLESQIDQTGDQAFFVPMSSLPEDHRFHQYQAAVHGTGSVPSEEVIKQHRERAGREYRVEPLGEHPIASARQAAE